MLTTFTSFIAVTLPALGLQLSYPDDYLMLYPTANKHVTQAIVFAQKNALHRNLFAAGYRETTRPADELSLGQKIGTWHWQGGKTVHYQKPQQGKSTSYRSFTHQGNDAVEETWNEYTQGRDWIVRELKIASGNRVFFFQVQAEKGQLETMLPAYNTIKEKLAVLKHSTTNLDYQFGRRGEIRSRRRRDYRQTQPVNRTRRTRSRPAIGNSRERTQAQMRAKFLEHYYQKPATSAVSTPTVRTRTRRSGVSDRRCQRLRRMGKSCG